MKKVGVYFKTNYYGKDFKNENVLYRNNKIEITDVKLIEFENGYLNINYKTNEYVSGDNTYHLDMKYIKSYYIF